MAFPGDEDGPDNFFWAMPGRDVFLGTVNRYIAGFFLSISMTFASLPALGQGRAHLSLGLNGGYAGLDSLNYIVDRFNEENPDYAKLLPGFHVPVGIYASAGGNFKRLLLELSFTMRTQNARARSEADLAGNEQQIQLRYNAHTVEIGTGYYIVDGDYTQVALGASLDFGQTRLLARRGAGTLQAASLPWGRMTDELNFAGSIFIQVMFTLRANPQIGLYFRPYYQFGFVRNDFGQVNRFLRPDNWGDDSFIILQRPSNVGLKTGVFIGS